MGFELTLDALLQNLNALRYDSGIRVKNFREVRMLEEVSYVSWNPTSQLASSGELVRAALIKGPQHP